MRASQLNDPLYDADDLDFDRPDPMRPIRLQYVTLSTEKKLLVDTLERLGLVHAWVGQNLYALNECESNGARLTAAEQLAREGLPEPTSATVTRRAEALLRQLVCEQSETVRRTAIGHPSIEVMRFAQDQRAIADAELAARGVDMKARLAATISEFEAA